MIREKAIEILKQRECCRECVADCSCDECENAFDMAIKALEQEPTNKKITKAELDSIAKAINEGWELRANEILDKIRAEIETKYGQCKLTEYIVQYDGVCTGANDIGDIADILQIIDKYKTEVEPQESEGKQDD